MIIGITGGIAAGKSAVAQELRALGGAVIDADLVARQVTAPGGAAHDEVVALFGAGIQDERGQINRARLGALVFGDVRARRQLEAITHPAIAREAERQTEELRAAGHLQVFYEAALLVESGRHTSMDRLIVVVAQDALRLGRMAQRDGLSEEEARQRINAQLPQEEKAALADYLIDNSGALEQTRKRVQEVWREIRREQKGAQEIR